MNRDQALQELKARLGPLDAYLRSRGIDIGQNGKKAFSCLNPDHPDIHPSMQCLGANVYCHSQKHTYDIIDLMAMDRNMTPGEFIKWGYEHFNITVDDGGTRSHRATAQEDFKPTAQANPPAEPVEDYTEYYKICHDRIKETDYPQQRELTSATIDRFMIGYDPAWISPTALKRAIAEGKNPPPPSPRLIIPTGPGSYIARDTRDSLTEYQIRWRKMKEGPSLIFNLQAIEQATGPIFIVEGEIDALSIIEAGGEAVGLGGTSNVSKLLKALEKNRPQHTLIVSLDKDEAGKKAEKELLEGLGRLKIPFLQADITGQYKDANEALVKEAAAFVQAVNETQQSAVEAQEEAAREADAARQERTGPGMVDHFLQAIQTRKYEPMPTGITDLDRAIGGGFIRQQIVLLGAAPGAGKTALAQWIFEGMAKRGTSCVFLNLEMAQEQVLARSISRIVAQQGGTIMPTSILQGYKWTEQQREQITAAAAAYREEIAPRMIYNPPGVTANLDSILEYIESEAQRAEAAGDQAPVCVLDYLQIVGGNDREDAAAIIKRAVEGLKAYAIRHNTLVFVIIAHNRESNKTGSATMEAGRDTSALEYSADLQMALNYTLCMKRPGQTKKAPDELTEDEKKQVTLKITKGRFGGAGKEVDLIFTGETMTYTQTTKDFDKPKPVRMLN